MAYSHFMKKLKKNFFVIHFNFFFNNSQGKHEVRNQENIYKRGISNYYFCSSVLSEPWTELLVFSSCDAATQYALALRFQKSFHLI